MKIEIYGSSDDIVGFRINGKADEIGAYDVNEKGPKDYLLISTIGGSRKLKVYPLYDGTWSFAVALFEEGHPFPHGWRMSFDREHEYSMRLIIESHDTEPLTVTWFRDGKEIKENAD